MSKMTRPLLLDLYCGAGGAATGYHRAGFDIVGVDIESQPHFPFEFYQADVLAFIDRAFLRGPTEWGAAAAIHASPPCQHYSTASGTARNHHGAQYDDLIANTRKALRTTGLPYIIENVANSPLIGSARLCGSTFGLNLRRHRYFETNWFLWSLPCDHGWQTPRFQSLDWSGKSQKGILASVIGVHGKCQYAGEFKLRCEAMGIDWMTNNELTQAIPPAYTEYIGGELLTAIHEGAA